MKKCIALVAVAVLLLGAAGQLNADTFGPGDHWVDTVTQGTDIMNTHGQLTVTVFTVPPATYTFGLDGPTEVWHDNVRDTPDPLDPGHFNYIDAEMVSINMAGNTPLGPVTMVAGDGVGNGISDGPLFSPGRIVEDPGDPALADSFFDVFFELGVPGMGVTVFNKASCPMLAKIDRVPPVRFVYVSQEPIDLYNKDDPNGPPVARLEEGRHTPEPSSLLLLAIGAVCLLGYAWRRRKR